MTEQNPHLPPEVEADLVALADDRLPAARRAEVEARVAAEPALAGALQRQRAALALIARLDTRAPLELRLRVEELKADPVIRRRRRRRRWLPVTGLAAAAATAALLVLVAGGGPAVDDALAVALRPPTAPAVAGDHVDGVRFPQSGKWRAVGARTDVVEGRAMRTVFYEREGRTIAYTIVHGPALDDEPLRVVGGPGGRRAVVWTNQGHTCVISGAGVDASVLRKLASWS
jgi:anti-sigma factor RsiW